jgi:hypothetical protein
MSDVYVVTAETYNEGGSVLGVSETLEGAQAIGRMKAEKLLAWKQIRWERERWETTERACGGDYLAIERFPLDHHEPTMEGRER